LFVLYEMVVVPVWPAGTTMELGEAEIRGALSATPWTTVDASAGVGEAVL